MCHEANVAKERRIRGKKRTSAAKLGEVDLGEKLSQRGTHVDDVADSVGGQESLQEVDNDGNDLLNKPHTLTKS